MIKKFLVCLAVLISALATFGLSTSSGVNAAEPYFKGRSDCDSFLGLTAWDCGVSISTDEDLKGNIWYIAANIAFDITIIAAYLVLGYVIYGGYLYTFSGGDPGKVAAGRKTLAHAFIGLAIVLTANIIMSSIRLFLLDSSGVFANCIEIKTSGISGQNCQNATDVVSRTINWFTAMIGIVSAIFVVYGGISYTTSTGDPTKVKKAKDMILYALIGLAVAALAGIITAFVTNIINNAT